MDLDALLLHYFGGGNPDSLSPQQLADGTERLAIDFGVESDPGRKFALWVLMEVFGIAPLPAEAFDDPDQRRAAENWLDAAKKFGGS